jgi:hypothetical protein
MTGTEQAIRQMLAEEWPEIRAMKEGKIRANDLFLVNRMNEFHQEIIKADRLRIERIKEEYQQQAVK